MQTLVLFSVHSGLRDGLVIICNPGDTDVEAYTHEYRSFLVSSG